MERSLRDDRNRLGPVFQKVNRQGLSEISRHVIGQIGERLVENQEAGVTQQRQRYQQPAALLAGRLPPRQDEMPLLENPHHVSARGLLTVSDLAVDQIEKGGTPEDRQLVGLGDEANFLGLDVALDVPTAGELSSPEQPE